jgi:hypothetical protein
VIVNPFGLSDENGTNELHVPQETVNNLQNTGMATMFSGDNGNIREELDNDCEAELTRRTSPDQFGRHQNVFCCPGSIVRQNEHAGRS